MVRPVGVETRRIEGGSLRPVEITRPRWEDDIVAWVEADPSVLGRPLLVIGIKVITTFGEIDIVAIDSDGTVWVIEVKLARADHVSLAQLARYGVGVRGKGRFWLETVYAAQRGGSLEDAFYATFARVLPADAGQKRRLVLLAPPLSERTTEFIENLRADLSGAVEVDLVLYRATSEDKGTIVTFVTVPGNAVTPVERDARVASNVLGSVFDQGEGHLSELRQLVQAARDGWGKPAPAPERQVSVQSKSSMDLDLVVFWGLYERRFVWDFLPTRFLCALYEQWRRSEAAAGVTRSPFRDDVGGKRLFGRAIKQVIEWAGGWEHRQKRIHQLLDPHEPLETLIPAWARPGPDDNVYGYERRPA